MKEKKKGIGGLLVIIAVLLLLSGAVAYFGFVNDGTAIRIREYLAEKFIENGKTDTAVKLYQDILSRDDQNKDAYLALADIYIRSKDYDEAHEILDEGLEAAGGQELADKQWSVYEREAKLIEKEGDDKALLDFVNNIPADKLKAYYEDAEEADDHAKSDAANWTKATLAIADEYFKAGDAKKAMGILEEAVMSPLNGFVDIQVFNDALIPVYLQLASEALTAEDTDSARYYYNRVLGLDPENKDATEGLAALDVEEAEDLWEYISLDCAVKTDLEINMHGLKVSMPVTLKLEMFYNGSNEGNETIDITETVSYTILGQKDQQSQFMHIYQDGKDTVIDSGLTGTQREKDTVLKDILFTFIADYHSLMSIAPSDSQQTVNGIKCDVSHAMVQGKNYLYYMPKDMLPEGVDKLMNSLILDVTRYTAADDGRIVRIEADMKQVDADAVNDMLSTYIGSINADISVKSMTVVIDVDAK